MLGLRVVRGPNWSWNNEDGGEGYTGTLYHINSDKTVIVQWDNGNQTLCKIGHANTYELRIIDNAQIGIIHKEIQCDECTSNGIRGPRYKCNTCYNYDLCDLCFLKNEHDPTHRFKKIDFSNFERTHLSSEFGSSNIRDIIHRGIQCDECNLDGICGTRYKCIDCSNFDLCELCYYKNKHDLSHRFYRIDSPNAQRINLPSRLNSCNSQSQDSVHTGVRCDECKTLDIVGIRYKCDDCYNFDLCVLCYRGNKHDLDHNFIKINSPNSVGSYLPPRLALMRNQKQGTVHRDVVCDGCDFSHIRGIRYKCKNCQNYDLCVFCYYRNKHDLSHSFSRIDYPGCRRIDLLPRITSKRNRKEGIVHRGIRCDGCNFSNIFGKRYKCNICRNYDLCEKCYSENKHDLTHVFKRFDCQHSIGAILPPRTVRNKSPDIVHENILCNMCSLADIYGIRYKCNHCRDYDLCYICYHGDKHDLNHSFTRIETPKSVKINLPPRLTSRKCQLRGIYKGAKVIPGIDWSGSNLDPEQDQPGVVLGIVKWNSHSSWRSAALVKWRQGNTQLCRLGFKGHCDIQFVEATSGISHYYPEHLPILGQMEVTEYRVNQNQQVNNSEDCSQSTATTSQNTPRNELQEAVNKVDKPVIGNERLVQLENKIAEMEEKQTCAICMENERNVVFLCGHGTCSTCANDLTSCHMCRKIIERKIRIY